MQLGNDSGGSFGIVSDLAAAVDATGVPLMAFINTAFRLGFAAADEAPGIVIWAA